MADSCIGPRRGVPRQPSSAGHAEPRHGLAAQPRVWPSLIAAGDLWPTDRRPSQELSLHTLADLRSAAVGGDLGPQNQSAEAYSIPQGG